jgi:endonuclease/exonuclease/phosphatase family metal-dependent hydrolase
MPPGGTNAPALILSGPEWSYKVVRGFRTDAKPFGGGEAGLTNLVIHGLWLNDPAMNGLGHNVFVPANGLAEVTGIEEGLAVFSRYPLRDPFMVPLSNPLGTWRRIALGVVVRCPWGEMLAVSTHHSLRRGRNGRQPERLRLGVEARAGNCPAIVGGDFNADESSSAIRALAGAWVDCYRAVNPVGDAPTHDLSGPFGLFERRDRLDYVFLRPGMPGLSVAEARHITTAPLVFSDHRAVLVRFRPMGARAVRAAS